MESIGGGFKDFLSSPLFGQNFQFDEYFSNGLKPPTRSSIRLKDYDLVTQVSTFTGKPLLWGQAKITKTQTSVVKLLDPSEVNFPENHGDVSFTWQFFLVYTPEN